MVQVYFTGLHCDEETDEVGADEPYVLVTTVDLSSSISVAGYPVPVPGFEVFRYGPYDDVDKGEFRAGPGPARSFWSRTGQNSPIPAPDSAIFVVSLMENDDGHPENLRGIIKGLVGGSVLGSLNLGRPDKVNALLRDIDSGMGTPTGAPNFDDKVGGPQELRFSADELRRAEAGDKVGKAMVFAGDGGRYTLGFEAHNPVPPTGQTDWRFCTKCRAMFWAGDGADQGRCTAGGAHAAQGLVFVLPFGKPETSTAQANWRFCAKCRSMFWAGDTANQGRCPAGAAHAAQGLNFTLPHDIPPGGQKGWRFCVKCRALFWAGDPHNQGACPAGAAHAAQGFDFVLPFAA